MSDRPGNYCDQSKPILVMVSISLTLDRVSGKLIFAGKLSGRDYGDLFHMHYFVSDEGCKTDTF